MSYMIAVQYSSCAFLSVSICVLVLIHELVNVTEAVGLEREREREREREYGCMISMVPSLFCWDLLDNRKAL